MLDTFISYQLSGKGIGSKKKIDNDDVLMFYWLEKKKFPADLWGRRWGSDIKFQAGCG